MQVFAFRRYLCYTEEVLLLLFIRNHFKRKKAGIMSEKRRARDEAWQAVKFTLFSASAGVIQVVSFELLSKALKLPYWGSYLTALCLSVLWNFTFNRRYTFRSDASVPRAMGLVALFYAVFTPLSTWGGSALTNGSWNEDLVLVLTMLLNFVLEFLYQKFVGYRNLTDTNDVAKRAMEKEQEKQNKVC